MLKGKKTSCLKAMKRKRGIAIFVIILLSVLLITCLIKILTTSALPGIYVNPIYKTGKYFDVEISIPSEYQMLKQGEELVSEIKIFNIEGIGLMDVKIEYSIKNLDTHKIIERGYETKAIEKYSTFIKRIRTTELEPGYYLFIVQIRYNNDIVINNHPFTILKSNGKIPSNFRELKFLLYSIIIVLIVFIIFLYYEHSKIKKEYRKERILKNHNKYRGKS